MANYRRSTMVYHYGRGTKALTAETEEVLSRVNRWLPVRRAAQAAPA